MSSVGRINLDLNINSRGFNRQVDNIAKNTQSKFSAMSIAVGNILANLATKAVASLGGFVKDCLDKGSELTELENVVDSVFTTMSDKVDNFAKNALDSYGLTEQQAKHMIGTFGAMSKSFGYTEAQAYDMSTRLTALAGDVASFYNLDIDESYTKMKSVYTGETESLKELGVVMTQAALDQFALANGYGRTTSQMTEQEKVALRLAFVENKLAVASGDVIRTQDSWANQTRRLAGQFESLKAAIGQGLINVLTPVLKVINIIMAKLVQLANAFKSFTEMITGKKSGGGGGSPAEAMQGVADAAQSASDATEGVSGSAKKAADSAKKAQKALMGFDEINKLTKTDTSAGAGGGGGGGAGGGVSFDNIDFSGAVEEQEKKLNSTIDSIKSKFEELVGVFKEGFKSGLGDDFEKSVERTKKHVSSIKKSVKSIFTDPKVISAADEWAEKVTFALGQVAGSAASIGQTIIENLVGGVDEYLKESKDYIVERIVGIFDVSGKIAEIIGNFCEAFAEIFEVFRGDNAKQITADIIGIFSDALLGVIELVGRLMADVLDAITRPIIENKDKIKKAIDDTLGPISKVLSTIHDSVKATFDKIFEVYDSKIHPMFVAIGDALSSMVDTITTTYSTYIAPILDKLADKFSKVWNEHIQPLINSIIDLFGKVADCVGKFWTEVLKPLVDWIAQNVVPVVAPVFEAFANLVMDFVANVADVLKGIVDALGGVIDFITGIFTGDWELAWTGIKEIFTGIWDAIKAFFSGIWDALCGIVDVAVKGIKAVISTVFNAIKSIFTSVWNHIKTFFGSILNYLKDIAKIQFEAIKAIIKSVMDAIKSIITSIWNAIKSAVSSALGAIKSAVSSAWHSIKSTISSLMGSIKSNISSSWTAIQSKISSIVSTIKSGVLSGFRAIKSGIASIMSGIKNNITSVFHGIWSFIKSIVNTIIGGIQKMINSIIGGLNAMGSALNALKFDVPDWVPSIGGKKFGLNVPKISTVTLPRLAQGGYVKANQPQPVIIGDNKTQGEIVAPEGKMLEVMLTALQTFFSQLKDAGYGAGNKAEAVGDISIPIYLDGTLLDEVIVTAQQRRRLRSGGR